jgi:hypothetical protein
MKQGLRTRSPAIRECCVLSEFSARENDSGSCEVNETGRQRDFFFTRAEFTLSTFIEPPNDLRSSVRNSYVSLTPLAVTQLAAKSWSSVDMLIV